MVDKKNNNTEKYVKWAKKLNQIGIALSSEKNILKLLEMILSESREFTNCDAGTFYRVSKNKKFLNFTVMHNDTFKEYSGGTSGIIPSLPPVPLFNDSDELNHSNVCTYVAHTKKPVNLGNVYKDGGVFAEGPKEYEELSGYKSESMLVVPMKNHDDKIIGVLQLINAKDADGNIIPFALELNDIIESLGSQAAVALETAELIDEIENLLKAIIKFTVKTIDERSSHTAGHSSRVAKYSRKLAKAISEQKEGPFADINYTDEEIEEIWVSALMHDVGKIGVRENVLDKHNRLDGSDFYRVLDRLDRIKDNMIYNGKLRNSSNNLSIEHIDAILDNELKELKEDYDFLVWLNKPGFLPDEKKEILDNIYKKSYTDSSGKKIEYLTEDEYKNFSVRKGNFTADQRSEMNQHVVITKKLLSKLPFPDKLKNVPFYAGSHHELINGKGYPDGLEGDEIPLPARIMCVADVWDAVTAQDRPYKPPYPLDRCIDILKKGAEFGEFDKDVVDLFLKLELWDKNKVITDEAN